MHLSFLMDKKVKLLAVSSIFIAKKAMFNLEIARKHLILLLILLNLVTAGLGYWAGRKQQMEMQKVVLEKIPDINKCF